jgi:hypothetical protein
MNTETLATRDHCEFIRRCILQQNGLCSWMFTAANLLMILVSNHPAVRLEAAFAFISLLLSTWISQMALERSLSTAGAYPVRRLNQASFATMLLACVATGIALVSFCWLQSS